jgi:ABC-2 type transport system permease protein
MSSQTESALQKPEFSQALTTHGRWSGYAGLLGARMKELFREPEVVFWIFLFPILLAFGLGIAFRNRPAEKVNVVFAQQAGSDQLINLLKAAPDAQKFNIQVQPPEQAANSFRLGKVDLEILPDGKGGVAYVYDPSRPDSVLARNVADDALQTAAGRKPALSSATRVNSEPGSRYIDFLIPGLLGMNLMGSGMWGIGFALVDMRQRKLLKRFIATPMRRSDFLLALASSRLLLMIIELVIVLGFGIVTFHMRVMGTWPAILLVSCLGAMTFAGLGLLTASRAQKIETASGIMNVIMMPMWIFSGIFFSYERFPAKVIPFIKLLPLTALNDSLRAVILEGKTLMSLTEPLLVLCLWGGLSFLIAVRLFRWT